MLFLRLAPSSPVLLPLNSGVRRVAGPLRAPESFATFVLSSLEAEQGWAGHCLCMRLRFVHFLLF